MYNYQLKRYFNYVNCKLKGYHVFFVILFRSSFLGVLKQVIDKCVAGTSVREICEFGDQLLTEETSKVFKKEKELKKGIAFPTCVSVNNCICHFSPIPSEADYTLKDEDVVKV